jgi:predicted RNase H-like nuclease (RuvC/YqgF family)
MLNWRRDPDYERRMNALAIRIQQTKNETEQIEKETELIKKDTERLRRENAKLKAYNAKMRHFISCVDQLCFPPECSSTPPPATENDCDSSSP